MTTFGVCMSVHEQLKAVRLSKGWSQEEMAEEIGYSKNGYAKIERGEASLNFAKLERIAKLLDVSLRELVGTKEGTIFNLIENCTHAHGNIRYSIVLSETECAHELEKAQLSLQEREKEIAYLKAENAQLKKIISLLEKTG